MKEEILKLLNETKEALDIITINDLLNLKTSEELQKLQENLDDLVKTFSVYKTKKEKYLLYENLSNLKKGVISINKQGNGFILLEDKDLYVNYINLNNAIDGDLVLAETFLYNNKLEGKIIKILKRDTENIIGTIYVEKNIKKFKLDDKNKTIKIILDEKSIKECVDGTKVIVKTTKDSGNNTYFGQVTKIIGHKNDPTIDIRTVAYKYGFFDDFNKEVISQIEDIPATVLESELKNRKDLTNENIFTIDGDDTKDIDDALSLKFENNIYELGVHIADVSHYVKKDTPLDKEAYERGTSVYLADSAIPMLPHKLSNGICSLNPNQVRLTISCVMKINENGEVIEYDVFPSYIKSKKQLTYSKINDILMRDIVADDYVEYKNVLIQMNDLAKILRKNKIKRGYIDFDIDEIKLLIDKTGKCIGVERRLREDGEKIIEDFMILANETIASHIYNLDLPFIYRIHGTPKQEKIDSFISLISIMGHKIVGKFKDIKPSSMQKILEQIKDKPEFEILSNNLLRSMQKAIYSEDNIGHFGLGSKCYTHFTSPIRRYPDLIVHRILKDFIFDSKINNETISIWEKYLPNVSVHTSKREQDSIEAEREVIDMKTAEYMEDHIGEIYHGIISGVTSFGFFVQLENLIEGLVHINTIQGDYFNYIPEKLSLIGTETNIKYTLGDKITVKVIAASKENKTIDFELVSDKNGSKK